MKLNILIILMLIGFTFVLFEKSMADWDAELKEAIEYNQRITTQFDNDPRMIQAHNKLICAQTDYYLNQTASPYFEEYNSTFYGYKDICAEYTMRRLNGDIMNITLR